MACGSCGGNRPTSPLTTWVNPSGVTSVASEVYVVRYPTGAEQEFVSESDAYHAIRLTGGSVSRKQVS